MPRGQGPGEAGWAQGGGEGGIREISEPGQRTHSHKAHPTAVSRCQGSPGGGSLEQWLSSLRGGAWKCQEKARP